MGLTPNEILNKEFNTKFRGYDPDQVNDYLDIIVADYERMINETHQLKQELEVAKEKNAYFAQLQESLNSSIIVAQEAADRLKQNARKESELILFEAEKESDRIINGAVERARHIVTESEALRRSSRTYRQRLENMVKSQLDIVAGEEYKALFDEEIVSNLNPADFREATARASSRVAALEEDSQEAFEAARDMIPEANQEIFTPSDLEVSELDQKELGQPIEDSLNDIKDPEELKNHKFVVDNKKKNESVLGQTIRIDLPARHE